MTYGNVPLFVIHYSVFIWSDCYGRHCYYICYIFCSLLYTSLYLIWHSDHVLTNVTLFILRALLSVLRSGRTLLCDCIYSFVVGIDREVPWYASLWLLYLITFGRHYDLIQYCYILHLLFICVLTWLFVILSMIIRHYWWWCLHSYVVLFY